MSNKPTYHFGESYEEESQQVGNASQTDINDDELPYMPSMPSAIQQPKPVQFVDLSNPEVFSRVENQSNQKKPQYNTQMEGVKEPDFNSAEKNMQTMGKIMGKINNLADETTGDETYAKSNSGGIQIAIENLNKAIKTLKDIDYWIPDGKQEYSSQLRKIAEPIARALTAYTNKVETLR